MQCALDHPRMPVRKVTHVNSYDSVMTVSMMGDISHGILVLVVCQGAHRTWRALLIVIIAILLIVIIAILLIVIIATLLVVRVAPERAF